MQYRLVDAVPADEPWLDDLRRRVYADLFVATWGGWDEGRHHRHFAACLTCGGISIIWVGGERVGMIQLAVDLEVVEVGELQVGPSYQNRGIGTSVLTDVLADARSEGKCVRLSTGLKNVGAIRLYKRLGFRQVGQSETHEHMEYL